MHTQSITIPPIGARVTIYNFGIHRGVVEAHDPVCTVWSSREAQTTCVRRGWVAVRLDNPALGVWHGAVHDGYGYIVQQDEYVILDPERPDHPGDVVRDLRECFPDEPDLVAVAVRAIERNGYYLTGGGAAPTLAIVRRFYPGV